MFVFSSHTLACEGLVFFLCARSTLFASFVDNGAGFCLSCWTLSTAALVLFIFWWPDNERQSGCGAPAVSLIFWLLRRKKKKKEENSPSICSASVAECRQIPTKRVWIPSRITASCYDRQWKVVVSLYLIRNTFTWASRWPLSIDQDEHFL